MAERARKRRGVKSKSGNKGEHGGRSEDAPRTRIVSVHLTKVAFEGLDCLVKMGVFQNKSEAIRVAVFNLLREQREALERRQLMELGYR